MSKKILITGGNGGIAQSIKKEMEKEGYIVYAPGRDEMDVTDVEMIDEVISQYVPDILINNAGYVVPQSIRNADLENTKKHIEINLSGVFFCTQTALRYNERLDIINITSAAAIETHATWSEYCATKAAVVMATKCWAEDNLYAVAISPGRTKTKMRKSLYPDECQDTLLEPDIVAKIVLKAINKEYLSGSHIVVKKQNVNELLGSNEQ